MSQRTEDTKSAAVDTKNTKKNLPGRKYPIGQENSMIIKWLELQAEEADCFYSFLHLRLDRNMRMSF